ncbi:DUF2529 family protein, partial [Anoxybacillus geothermalis]|nr:DUF2529 family protein [Anoxybacillus geothermalis]
MFRISRTYFLLAFRIIYGFCIIAAKGGQMMKILATQTIGLLQKIAADEEWALEDGARLLAQAVVG